MLNTQTFLLKLIKQSLALAIIFCLSGITNIVCCFAKCQTSIEKTCHQNSSNLTTSCHESDPIDQTTCNASSETSQESSCSQDDNQNCCITDNTSDSDNLSLSINDLNTCDFLTTNNLENIFSTGSSCRMKCCLPSEETVDIPRVPRLDDLKTVTITELSYSNFIKEQVVFISFPNKKIADQEKTYLWCCVFLI